MLLSLGSIFASSFVIALSGALMPGPLLTVTVSESTRRGRSAGPLMILGHGILELLLIIALLIGLAPVLTRNDVFIIIALSGGLILAWMAYGLIRSLPAARLEFSGSGERQRRLVLSGIALSLANPYWLLWWVTIGLGYIMYSVTFGIWGLAAFFLGHIMADLAWYSLVSYGVAKGRNFITDSAYRKILGICAGCLIIFSAYFIWSGVSRAIQLTAT